MSAAGEPPSEAELHAYVDDQLSAERRAEVEEWLRSHPAERARLDAYARQNRLIRELFPPVEGDGGLGSRLLRRLHRRAARWRLAASVLLLLTGFAAGYGTARLDSFARRPPPREVAVALDGIRAYRVYVSEVRHPVEVGADEEAHLVAWLSNRLGAPLRAPDLTASGYVLIGGRLLPDARGRPAAQFMYEDAAGRRITLYLSRDGDREGSSFRYWQRGEVAAFSWREEGLAFALVGPPERELLLRLARDVYAQYREPAPGGAG